ANFGGHLADHLTIRAFDGELRIFFDGDLDLVGDQINDGVGIAEAKVDVFSGDSGFKADALDFELFDKTFTDAADHVVDERAAEAVQSLGLGVFAFAANDDVAILNLEAGSAGQFPIEFAFGAFDGDPLP